jgi:hypothetical protein
MPISRIVGPAPNGTLSTPAQLQRHERHQEPAPVPNPYHKVTHGNNGSGPLGAPALAYRVIDETPKTRPAPLPASDPVVAETALAKFQEFARANPPKDALEKQRYLKMARDAQLADNPTPVQQDGETHGAFIGRCNEHFSRLGLAFRLNQCPGGIARPQQGPNRNRAGVAFDPMRSR